MSDKRIIITHVVSSAIERLKAQAEMIEKAFLNSGVSIRPDRTEDNLIRIKGIPIDKIDFIGWELAEEIILKAEYPVDALFDNQEFLEANDNELLLIISYHEERVKAL